MGPVPSPLLPSPRGPVSEVVLGALRRRPGPVHLPALDDLDVLGDDDAQLALACCYELHYRSFAGVDDGWEWQPELLALRRGLEDRFVCGLVEEVGPPAPISTRSALSALRALVAGPPGGPSL